MKSEDQPQDAEFESAQLAAREAMDKLNDANRILQEARMLSENRPLTPEEIQDVISRFNHYTGENAIPARIVARQCGYASSVLSSWASGTYKGDTDGVTRAINAWMERDARRRQSRRPKDYIKTWIAEDIRTYAYLADKRTCMAAIVVPAGAGKTMVLKTLTQEMRGVYVYCDENITARDLYRAIAQAVGWDNRNGTRGELLRFIVEKLTGTGRILFIDEAQNAGRHIGSLRSIYDRANVPIVMAGTDEILTHVNDRAHGRGQMSSRCIRYNAMDYVSNVEGGPGGSEAGRDLFTLEEIQAFFAMKKIRIDREGMRLLWALSCLPNYGTLRLVENIIDTVLDSNPEVQVVSRDDVVAALQSLVGAEAMYLQQLARRHVNINRTDAPVVKAG